MRTLKQENYITSVIIYDQKIKVALWFLNTRTKIQILSGLQCMLQNETENGDGEEIRQYFRSADLVELFERMEEIRKSNIDEKFYPLKLS